MEPGCGVCKRAKMQIFAMQTAGKSDSQILDQFVAENGKQILAITPGSVRNGGSVCGAVAGRDRRAAGDSEVSQTARAGSPEIDPEVLERINKDMAKLD